MIATNKITDQFEVYVCIVEDEVVFVGQGPHGEHKHCTSGSSPCYGLNKLHFENKKMDIKLYFKSTQADAIELQEQLIDLLKPSLMDSTPITVSVEDITETLEEVVAVSDSIATDTIKAEEEIPAYLLSRRTRGRASKINFDEIRSAMSVKGSTYKQVAETLKVSTSTIQRALYGNKVSSPTPKTVTDKHSKIKKLEGKGLTREEIASIVGVSAATVYRVLRK